MATVNVEMQICDKAHGITVTPRDDGKFDVLIKTDCIDVEQYWERIKTITMDDIAVMKDSSVEKYENTQMLCNTCLVQKAVLYAAWIETGLISANRAAEYGVNTISFVPDRV